MSKILKIVFKLSQLKTQQFLEINKYNKAPNTFAFI